MKASLRLRASRALAIAAMALSVAVAVPAVAAQRNFVKSDGVDNPACSIANPCRQFAAALAAVDPGGEVVVLDSAGYGTATIAQSVSIIAPAGIYAGISVFSGDGIAVNGAGIVVKLRGLTIIGQGGVFSGSGIDFMQGASMRVENCVVSGMPDFGIYAQAANAVVTVTDTAVHDNLAAGIYVTGAVLANLERIDASHNSNFGVLAIDGPSITIVDSSLNANYVGASLTSSAGKTTKMAIRGTTIAFNMLHGVSSIRFGPGAATILGVDTCNISNNGGTGIDASDGAASSTARLDVTATMIDNNGSGIVIGSADVSATLTGNTIHYNNGDGLTVNAGNVVLAGNTITRNLSNGVNLNAGAVQSLRDNTITFNGTDVTGTIAALPGL